MRALEAIPNALTSNMLSFRDSRSKVLPRVLEMCSEAGPVSTRLDALKCVQHIFHLYDADTIRGPILNAVNESLKVDPSRQLAMSALNTYDVISSKVPLSVAAEIIGPALFKIALHKKINLSDLQETIAITRKLIDRIETHRCEELKEASFLREESETQNLARQDGSVSIESLLEKDEIATGSTSPIWDKVCRKWTSCGHIC